jgi:hypothetical protein
MLLVFAAAVPLAGGAFAQSGGGTPARLRGKVDAVSEGAIRLTLRNGAKAEAKLPANVRVVWLTLASRTIRPPASTTHTLALSSDTSIPA